MKRTKSDPVKPDTECDSASGGESPKGDSVPPVEGQGVKEVTNGVKEVDLEDKDKLEDASSILPEGVPLPDSPSGSAEPESASPEPEPAESDADEETQDQERADDNKDSVASSVPEDDAEAEPVTANADTSADDSEIALAQEVTIAVESGLHFTPETLEVKT